MLLFIGMIYRNFHPRGHVLKEGLIAIILYEHNINEPKKKIEKINDLITIFINNEEVKELLNEALLLLGTNEKKIKKALWKSLGIICIQFIRIELLLMIT